jgi:methyl-accepting chemotaxis protein
MSRSWTFGRKIGAGFALVVALTMLVGAVAIYALRTVVASKDKVISSNVQNLIYVERLRAAVQFKVTGVRGFLLTRQAQYIEDMQEARAEISSVLDRLKENASGDEGKRLVSEVTRFEQEHQDAVERIVTQGKAGMPADDVLRQFDNDVLPVRTSLDEKIGALRSLEEKRMEDGKQSSSQTASLAITVVLLAVGITALLAISASLVLTRTLSGQIGSAVQHVQSSSSELQVAANQQASGAKEQATVMTEITTTARELLATSKQIADSAQRVAHIAEDTVKAARSGEQTVSTANDSIGSIKRQVDLIMTHMLDLGKKSQQIGGILELINELAEQTNILAINATIEAAGAGETGKRFAVVADEIRKLADRVGGSTKEIRSLIDEIQTAVNTTVMTTEGGIKAVDAGADQFMDVASTFKQIANLVGTTTEAVREIELSTKQQSTAVEQVTLAVTEVAKTTKETEVSSNQTYQTASQLTTLSRDLLRLIQPQATA